MATAVRTQKTRILAANAEDVTDAKAAGLSGAALDRLTLDAGKDAEVLVFDLAA